MALTIISFHWSGYSYCTYSTTRPIERAAYSEVWGCLSAWDQFRFGNESLITGPARGLPSGHLWKEAAESARPLRKSQCSYCNSLNHTLAAVARAQTPHTKQTKKHRMFFLKNGSVVKKPGGISTLCVVCVSLSLIFTFMLVSVEWWVEIWLVWPPQWRLSLFIYNFSSYAEVGLGLQYCIRWTKHRSE